MPASDDASDDQRSGRITYDERGNAVWEWKLETGVYSRDISTSRLRKLALNDLSIAETAKHQRPPGLDGTSSDKAVPGGGFNPYDNTSSARGNVGSNPYHSGAQPTLKAEPQAHSPATHSSATQGPANQSTTNEESDSPGPRKPMDLKKLQEWIEIRKRVQQNKLEDEDD
jgi:hypothetical protein